MNKKTKKLDPIPPGEFLLEDFLEPLGISQNKLARDIDVPTTRINGIVNGTRSITPDTALRLGRYFSTGAQVQLNLQQKYDLQMAEDDLLEEIERRIEPCNLEGHELVEA